MFELSRNKRTVYSYRILYRLTDELATVVAVIHSRRLLAAIEERLAGEPR